MKFCFLFLLFVQFAEAEVLNLGTIGNKKELLDERYTLSATDDDRQRSVNLFYKDKNDEMLQFLGTTTEIKKTEVNINQEWEKLLEGKI